MEAFFVKTAMAQESYTLPATMTESKTTYRQCRNPVTIGGFFYAKAWKMRNAPFPRPCGASGNDAHKTSYAKPFDFFVVRYVRMKFYACKYPFRCNSASMRSNNFSEGAQTV